VPRREGNYLLTTHMPWIGERTRALDGAHVEFFRGIENVVGVKLGPKVDPYDAVKLFAALSPTNEAGKLVAITRMGAAQVESALPPLVEAVRRANRRVLWVCDPMHGNGITTATGLKTRSFDDILKEIELTFAVHRKVGSELGGVHFELTGEDVTECIGGGLTEADLDKRYLSVCDPRLNYAQALEMAFRTGRWMNAGSRRL
jgi:3-deoxy-7-phosphoheptulonate synthase